MHLVGSLDGSSVGVMVAATAARLARLLAVPKETSSAACWGFQMVVCLAADSVARWGQRKAANLAAPLAAS